ncbi:MULTISPECIES: hypothetical protein [unclassified Nostoc]|uniref:hypothetical protein n=1 Tax=unclassified Nostoc TaxID=2593658 RepID=UPI002AD2C234|nr:hypothetical protein [Nostoc sp. DedQUE03]MDZ7974020.1 hypothetical protein [Nostoc sp. DedQUE03]MDZ8048521.1 hypothetical protein [Nostoc sp. DedQUE02]
MNFIVEVLQVVDQEGLLTGKWRLTVRTNAKPYGLCTHVHDSYESAWNCTQAWQAAKKLTGDSG